MITAETKLCCGTNLFASHSLETALREIADAGIRYVDLWASPKLCNHIDPNRDKAEEIRLLLNRYGLTAVALTAYLINEQDRDARIRFAHSLGIPVAIWEPAPSPDWSENMTNLKPGCITYGPEGGSSSAYFARLQRDLANSPADVSVCMEVPHRYTLNETLYQIWRTRQAVNDSRLLYAIAPPHCSARGFTAVDVLRIVGAEQAYMLYLWDIQAGYSFPESDGAFGDGAQQLLGGGCLDYRQIIDDYRSSGFTGWYNISCHGTEGWSDLNRVRVPFRRAVALACSVLAE